MLWDRDCKVRNAPVGSSYGSRLPLQAMMDAGITAAVGDTSWPMLRNQANPWEAQVLSKAANQTVDGAHTVRSTTEGMHASGQQV